MSADEDLASVALTDLLIETDNPETRFAFNDVDPESEPIVEDVSLLPSRTATVESVISEDSIGYVAIPVLPPRIMTIAVGDLNVSLTKQQLDGLLSFVSDEPEPIKPPMCLNVCAFKYSSYLFFLH